MTKKILIIGDTHIGSNVSLMPEEVYTLKTEKENCMTINASPVQKKILNKWYEMIDLEGRVDALVVNGDIVDGYNRKGNGIGCWTTDMDVQMQSARSLIKDVHYRKLYGTQGSLYHTNENISVDKLVIESLGGTFNHDLALKADNIRMHFSHRVGVSGSTWQYRCYSEDTEVLTESGEWKKHNEVINGERIAIYNPETEQLFFDAPISLFNKHYDGDMIEFSNKRGSNVLVTPNHKMWVKTYYPNKQYGFEYAGELSKHNHIEALVSQPFDLHNNQSIINIPESTIDFAGHIPKFENINISIDDWFEFLGYYVSEGGRQSDPSNSNHQVTFAQKTNEKSTKMTQCFDKLGLHYSKSNKDLHRWTFNRKQLWEYLQIFGSSAPTKHIPHELLMSAPKSALLCLFKAMMLGDGSVDIRTNFTDVYYTTSIQLASDMQLLATLLGYPARIALHGSPRQSHHHQMYRVYLKSYNTATLYPKIIKYSGNVVCFETNTGLYLTRRPGCYPTIQGNTTPIAKEMVMNELNQMDFERFNVIARHHAHYYCAVQFGNSLGLICPCWKGRDEFVKLLGLAFNPSIGYVVLEVNGNDYTWRHNLMHLKGEDAMHTYNISMEEL